MMEEHVMESEDYPKTLLSGLSVLYERSALVDCRLSFQDGESLMAHKCVLAAASKYLKTQIEKGSLSSGVLMIKAVSSTEFAGLLHFMYTGQLKLNPTSIWDITSAAAILDMPDALKLCREYVEIHGGLVAQQSAEEEAEETKPDLQGNGVHSKSGDTTDAQVTSLKRKRGRRKKDQNFTTPSRINKGVKSSASSTEDSFFQHLDIKQEVEEPEYEMDAFNEQNVLLGYDEDTDENSDDVGNDMDDTDEDDTYVPPPSKQKKKKTSTTSSSTKTEQKLTPKRRKNASKPAVTPGSKTKSGGKRTPGKSPKGSKKSEALAAQVPQVPYPKYACTFCNFKFFHYSSLQLHLRQHKVKPILLHTLHLTSRKYKRTPIQTCVHESGSFTFKCKRCSETFTNRKEALTHFRKSHKTLAVISCRICERKFSTGRDLLLHGIAKHKKVRNKFSTSVTVGAEEDTGLHECDMCPKVFLYTTNFKRHLQQSHNVGFEEKPQKRGLYYCRHCQAMLTNKHMYITHLTGHQLTEKEVQLEFYAMSFPYSEFDPDDIDASAVLQRLGLDSSNDLMKEDQNLTESANCGISKTAIATINEMISIYNTASEFGQEPRVRSKISSKSQKIMECNFCDYKSKYPSNLKRHVMQHTGERIQCPQCDKLFTCNFEMKSHIKIHHDKEPLTCDICSRKFQSKSGLYSHHHMYHLKTEKYKCSVCNKGFYFKNHFIGHMNGHNSAGDEKRAFICPNAGCGRKYVYQNSLNAHVKVCTGPKKPKPESRCEICNLVLSCAQALKDHMSGAHENKFYECHCGKFFKWRGSFYNHKKKCHPARCYSD